MFDYGLTDKLKTHGRNGLLIFSSFCFTYCVFIVRLIQNTLNFFSSLYSEAKVEFFHKNICRSNKWRSFFACNAYYCQSTVSRLEDLTISPQIDLPSIVQNSVFCKLHLRSRGTYMCSAEQPVIISDCTAVKSAVQRGTTAAPPFIIWLESHSCNALGKTFNLFENVLTIPNKQGPESSSLFAL